MSLLAFFGGGVPSVENLKIRLRNVLDRAEN